MTDDSTGSEEPEGWHRRIGQHVGALVASPMAAAVGVVAAVAQVIDYLQDHKAGLVGLVVAALAGLVGITIGWRHRRSLGNRLTSVGWPGYIIYGCALIGAVSVAAAAATVVLPGRTDASADPPPPTSTQSSPRTSPSPTAQPTTAPAPSAPPLADGVTCGSAAPEKATITSVYSADGGKGLGDDVVVAFTIREPPTDGASYWLMVYADDVPRNLHHVWQKLAPGDTTVRHTIRADVGSHRQIYVAQSSPGDETWFAKNLSRDRDDSWDGNRVDLPQGAQKVSNVCDATRKR